MALAAALAVMPGPVSAENLSWQPWSVDLFKTATAQHRLVILDLEAVWCHWCHVMASETYANPQVSGLIAEKFIAVRVDQDANPDISNRYGDWGWPATIVFAPDGTELAKLRGFVPPVRLASLLQAFVDDPTPGPSAEAADAIEPAATAFLSPSQRATLHAAFLKAYDRKHGGWQGLNKFVDTDSLNYALHLAETGNADAEAMVKQTLDGARSLIDPVWGGVFQYSDTPDWKTPHFEKIMWSQARLLEHFAEAYVRWHRPEDLSSAKLIAGYLERFLTSDSGAFFTSQDADVSPELLGKDFYALAADKRDALGRTPHVDQHVYARENGWAISGLVAYANASGDGEALQRALKAARVMMATRRIEGGGFRHGEADRSGPYLGDTLAMGEASLALYAATGEREWLSAAREAGRFIVATFKSPSGGYGTSAKLETSASAGPLNTPVRVMDEQIAAARFLNLVGRYSGEDAMHAAAEHALRYAAAPAVIESGRPLPGVLLADWQASHEPAHVTVVGGKGDALAKELNATARALPSTYARIDWWDKREGALDNPDVTYPELETPAAFLCTNRICSLPAFTSDELKTAFERLVRPAASGLSTQ
jgi:hypothetical protein